MNWYIGFEPIRGLIKNAFIEATGWFCIHASIFNEAQEKFAETVNKHRGMFL